jgi:hypothetical protein
MFALNANSGQLIEQITKSVRDLEFELNDNSFSVMLYYATLGSSSRCDTWEVRGTGQFASNAKMPSSY